MFGQLTLWQREPGPRSTWCVPSRLSAPPRACAVRRLVTKPFCVVWKVLCNFCCWRLHTAHTTWSTWANRWNRGRNWEIGFTNRAEITYNSSSLGMLTRYLVPDCSERVEGHRSPSQRPRTSSSLLRTRGRMLPSKILRGFPLGVVGRRGISSLLACAKGSFFTSFVNLERIHCTLQSHNAGRKTLALLE